MGFHLNLDLPYRQLNDGCNYIIEQYFDVKLLMNKYLNIAWLERAGSIPALLKLLWTRIWYFKQLSKTNTSLYTIIYYNLKKSNFERNGLFCFTI